MKKNILDQFTLFLFRRIKNTKLMAKNLREPKDFLIGYIARKVMQFDNQEVIEGSVERLDVQKGEIVLEVGSGNGQALIEIIRRSPRKIYAIEISKKFRDVLHSKFSDQNISILGNDAKDLSDVVETNSIDKLLLINVIYFLNPLDDYLKEFKRVIKKSGSILIVSKFHLAKTFDQSVFQNTDEASLIPKLQEYFEVSCESIESEKETSQYQLIFLKTK